MQTQDVHLEPNQRPFLTHGRAQIFKFLRQQERAQMPLYLLRPDQQVPQSLPMPETRPSAIQKPLDKAAAQPKEPLAEPIKSTLPSVPSVPILLEETKASLMLFTQKRALSFSFLEFYRPHDNPSPPRIFPNCPTEMLEVLCWQP